MCVILQALGGIACTPQATLDVEQLCRLQKFAFWLAKVTTEDKNKIHRRLRILQIRRALLAPMSFLDGLLVQIRIAKESPHEGSLQDLLIAARAHLQSRTALE